MQIVLNNGYICLTLFNITTTIEADSEIMIHDFWGRFFV